MNEIVTRVLLDTPEKQIRMIRTPGSIYRTLDPEHRIEMRTARAPNDFLPWQTIAHGTETECLESVSQTQGLQLPPGPQPIHQTGLPAPIAHLCANRVRLYHFYQAAPFSVTPEGGRYHGGFTAIFSCSGADHRNVEVMTGSVSSDTTPFTKGKHFVNTLVYTDPAEEPFKHHGTGETLIKCLEEALEKYLVDICND